MKKILLSLFFILLPLPALAESITSFQSDITLGSDGAFSVEETITYDFGSADRHGIFRFVPTDHVDDNSPWFRDRYVDIEILNVLMDGANVPYEVSENFGELEVKIGDPDRTISGEHIYEITYRVEGALYYYDNGTIDLYWNVTGNGWEVPMGEVTARIYDPEAVGLSEASCYQGDSGESDPCSVIRDNGVMTFGGVSLAPHEGLTIARALNPDKVQTLILERWSLWPLWLLGALGWLLWLTWFLVHYYREHRTGRVIIAQYEPYEKLRPMYTGVLFDGRVDTHDITAGIVTMAEEGFIKVRHVGRKVWFLFEADDYEIVVTRPYSKLNTEFQKLLFQLLFSENAQVGDKVVLSELAKDYSKKTTNFKLLNELRSAAEADLIKDGYFKHEWKTPGKIILRLFSALLGLVILMALIGAELVMPIVTSAVVLIISSIALLLVYRRRTQKGYEAQDHLKGFKEFLSVTDKERFKFHNAPQKSPEQFLQYLPYAIAFGVEKEWATAFKDVTIAPPSWYEGQGTAFNAVYLTNSLETFGTSVASASGSSSASSGGGSVGGGAGGGGGGSW